MREELHSNRPDRARDTFWGSAFHNSLRARHASFGWIQDYVSVKAALLWTAVRGER